MQALVRQPSALLATLRSRSYPFALVDYSSKYAGLLVRPQELGKRSLSSHSGVQSTLATIFGWPTFEARTRPFSTSRLPLRALSISAKRSVSTEREPPKAAKSRSIANALARYCNPERLAALGVSRDMQAQLVQDLDALENCPVGDDPVEYLEKVDALLARCDAVMATINELARNIVKHDARRVLGAPRYHKGTGRPRNPDESRLDTFRLKVILPRLMAAHRHAEPHRAAIHTRLHAGLRNGSFVSSHSDDFFKIFADPTGKTIDREAVEVYHQRVEEERNNREKRIMEAEKRAMEDETARYFGRNRAAAAAS